MANVNNSSPVIVNELLCFMQNNVSNVPKLNIINVGCTFYTSDEVVDAKAALYGYAELVCDDLPRCVQRRPSDNKKKLDFEDIHNLWMHLDVNKLSFPIFAAANLKRIPPVNPSEAEICALATNVSSLQQEVEALSNLKSSVLQLNEKLKDVHEAVCNRSHVQVPRMSVSHAGSSDASVGDMSDSVLYSAVAAADDDGYTLVTKKKDRPRTKLPSNGGNRTTPPLTRSFTGQAENSAVNGVPRRLVAYASRLHSDTTDHELKGMLEQAGVKDVLCYKLVPKDGKTYKTSAFRVSCNPLSASVFYNESTWPKNCEVRDWIFYNK